MTDEPDAVPTALKRVRRGRLLSEALPREGAAGRSARRGDGELDGGQRLLILDILIKALGGAYAHLPAKRAAYANDPIQALTLLRRRAADLSNAEFHRAVSGIVTGLRDAHTRYIGPETLRGQVAVLPFLVEQYGPDAPPGIWSPSSTPRPSTPTTTCSDRVSRGRRRRQLQPGSELTAGTAFRSPEPSRSTPTTRPAADPTRAAPEPSSP